jgi:hypothetical protein
MELPLSERPPEKVKVSALGSDGVSKMVWAYRDYQAENVAVPPTAGWPMAPCVSSGVHPEQASELRNHFERHGLNIEVTPQGDPIYKSSSERKAALKSRGQHDRSSY